jgi:hypothetical protein
MANHIAAILDLKSQIQDTGETLDNIHIARAMVLSLPKTQSWDIIKNQLFNVKSTKLTIDAVSTKLQSEANCCACEAVGGSTAVYTQTKDPGKCNDKPDPFYACHDGGHQGHTIDDYPYSQRNIKVQAKSAPKSTNLMTHALCDLGTYEIGQVYMATTSNSATKADNVLLDSTAMLHMFQKYYVFTNYRPSIENETIWLETSTPFKLLDKGV